MASLDSTYGGGSTTAWPFLSTLAAHAQQTWTGNFSSLWNSPFNWSPPGVPNGTAIFGQSSRTMITPLLPSTIGTIQFNQGAPAYTISPFSAFAINGGGIVNNSSNAPTLNVGFSLQFFNASTASNATIVTQSLAGLQFFNKSTAGNATIITESLGFARFFDTSTGGQARSSPINSAWLIFRTLFPRYDRRLDRGRRHLLSGF